jgi:hypothetical protein
MASDLQGKASRQPARRGDLPPGVQWRARVSWPARVITDVQSAQNEGPQVGAWRCRSKGRRRQFEARGRKARSLGSLAGQCLLVGEAAPRTEIIYGAHTLVENRAVEVDGGDARSVARSTPASPILMQGGHHAPSAAPRLHVGLFVGNGAGRRRWVAIRWTSRVPSQSGYGSTQLRGAILGARRVAHVRTQGNVSDHYLPHTVLNDSHHGRGWTDSRELRIRRCRWQG